MARLHENSDDELPDISALIGPTKKQAKTELLRRSKKAGGNAGDVQGQILKEEALGARSPSYPSQGGRTHQKPLRSQTTATSRNRENKFLLPWMTIREGLPVDNDPAIDPLPPGRASPTRKVKRPISYRERSYVLDSDYSDQGVGDESAGSLVDFIVDDDYVSYEDSDAEDKENRRRSRGAHIGGLFRAENIAVQAGGLQGSQGLVALKDRTTHRIRSGSHHIKPDEVEKATKQPDDCTFKATRLVTPPPSPRKPSKLASPTKQPRIPPSPHRPSIDAFWSQELINSWNEQYSPRKVAALSSPRKKPTLPASSADRPTSSTCPPPTSPNKRDRRMLEAKRAFERTKHDLAMSFLKEIDQKVGGGQIANMAASTGGIKLVWSKKLNTTAGRAHWKREVLRERCSSDDGDALPPRHRHHASIELSEKVIDDEHRLINVIAHEYCHLANFMISGVKNCPHGKEFKKWAHKTSQAFHHRGVDVTTKHSYSIDYKYVWRCTQCPTEFKRHSRSIDPARHTCGACKGRIEQTKPAPRRRVAAGAAAAGRAAASGAGVLSAYQMFVKENFGRVRTENPARSLGQVMEMVAAAYRARKARGDEFGSTATAGRLERGSGSLVEELVGGEGLGKGEDTLQQVCGELDALTLSDDEVED